jgi:hypothetical protein
MGWVTEEFKLIVWQGRMFFSLPVCTDHPVYSLIVQGTLLWGKVAMTDATTHLDLFVQQIA